MSWKLSLDDCEISWNKKKQNCFYILRLTRDRWILSQLNGSAKFYLKHFDHFQRLEVR